MATPANPAAVQIQSLMTAKVHCIPTSATIYEAIGCLLKHRIHGAPIVDADAKVVSVISEGDLLKIAAKGGLDKTMSDCLPELCKTANLVTVKKTDTFAHAYMKFMSKNVRRLLVVDEAGRIAGIVSRSNVLQLMYDSKKTVLE